MNYQKIIARLCCGDLRKFRNIHKGESCYLIGNGPSVKWFDLTLFGNYPSISCGMVPFHKDFNKLDCRYISIVEPWLFAPKSFHSKELQGFDRLAKEYRKLITHTPKKKFFINLSNRFFLSGSNVNYVYYGIPDDKCLTGSLLQNTNLFAGSFHATLTLAYYLGFTKVYLVGFDSWTMQPSYAMRWYEYGEKNLFYSKNLATDFLDILKQELEIYTIGVNARSDNVKVISYEELTGKQPVYKENNEILDEYYLKILADCYDCKIYS